MNRGTLFWALAFVAASSASAAVAEAPVAAVAEPVAVVSAGAETAAVEPQTRVDAAVGLAQFVAVDDVTGEPLAFTQLRTTGKLDQLGGIEGLTLRVDGRTRRSFHRRLDDLTDISRLHLQLDGDSSRWVLGIGRQRILSLFGTHVDGLFVGRRVGESTRAGAFVGMSPHPRSRKLDIRFPTAGLAYDTRSASGHHGGALVLQLYEGELDRAYLTERVRRRLTETLWLYGHGVVDVLAPHGIMQDLSPKHRAGRAKGIDLTNAQLRLLYRPRRELDASIGALHTHALLPSRFWQDWLQRERERRGLLEDETVPSGTRRSSVRVASSLRFATGLTCFATARYDYRHNDHARGWFARPGIRATTAEGGSLELAYSYRDYYGVIQHRADATTSLQLGSAVMLDVTASATQWRAARQGSQEMLYDVGATAHVVIPGLSPGLGRVDVALQYQGFFEPSSTFHVVYARLRYGFRSGS